MGKWEKHTLIFLPCAAIVMFVAGDISMSKYGLDPPYIYFHAGSWLKLASFAAAAGAVTFAIFVAARRYLKRKPMAEHIPDKRIVAARIFARRVQSLMAGGAAKVATGAGWHR